MTKSPFTVRAHSPGAAFALLALALGSPAAAQDPLDKLTKPVATVPQFATLEGEFVRIAYNNEGYVSMGYRMAQIERGREWILLQVGITLRDGMEDYVLERKHVSVRTPDKTIALATQSEYSKANLMALNERSKISHDSINYFPPEARNGTALSFFADPSQARSLSRDQAELSSRRAAMGRLYFHVPGGIQPGQYWLDVQFPSGPVQVPFRIFTEEEEKSFRKRWEDLKKEHEAAFGN